MSDIKKVLKLKRLWMLLLFPIAGLLFLIAKLNPWFAEFVFARGIFKVYSQILSNITGLLPFSLAEIGIIVLIFAVPALLIFEIVYVIRHKGKRLYLLFRDIATLFCVASLVLFMLIMGCSINYYRYSFADIVGLKVRDSSKNELYDLCVELTERTNEARAKLTTENEKGCFILAESKRELAKKCKAAYKELSKELDVVSGFYPATKLVLNSNFMSRLEFTGMYVPFTMEANVNQAVPEYSIAATMCHELAHLRGFIREDEANYVAYLACLASGDDELIYSALMDALIYAGNALAEQDIDKYYETCRLRSEGVSRDLGANNEYWEQYDDTPISNVADSINDSYLIMNNQPDGVKSYGRMVDYLLAEYRQKHGLD